jgi:hypothetical protein
MQMAPTGPGERNEQGQPSSGFDSAKAYRELYPGYEGDPHRHNSDLRAYQRLVRKRSENPNLAELQQEYDNEVALERLSDAAVPVVDERWRRVGNWRGCFSWR